MGKKKKKEKNRKIQIIRRKDVLLCPYFRITEFRDPKAKGFYADCFCLYDSDKDPVPYPFAYLKFKSNNPSKRELNLLRKTVIENCYHDCPKMYESFWIDSLESNRKEDEEFSKFLDSFYPMNDTILALPPSKDKLNAS